MKVDRKTIIFVVSATIVVITFSIMTPLPFCSTTGPYYNYTYVYNDTSGECEKKYMDMTQEEYETVSVHLTIGLVGLITSIIVGVAIVFWILNNPRFP